MKAFVSASLIKAKKEEIDEQKINRFIAKFNDYLLEGNEEGDNFVINSIIDAMPLLNDNEFKLVVKLAESQGWNLTRNDDELQNIAYKMEKTVNKE